MHSPDRSCRYYIQDVFFWCLAGPVAQTGKAVVHWIGCISTIKINLRHRKGQGETETCRKGMDNNMDSISRWGKMGGAVLL